MSNSLGLGFCPLFFVGVVVIARVGCFVAAGPVEHYSHQNFVWKFLAIVCEQVGPSPSKSVDRLLEIADQMTMLNMELLKEDAAL